MHVHCILCFRYTWAIAQAGETTRARFLSVGEKYTLAPDVQKEGGPLWLYAYLAYTTVKDASGLFLQFVLPAS